MVRCGWVLPLLVGCADHRTWFDSGSYEADYATVDGQQAHVAYLDHWMYLAWQNPGRTDQIELCGEHHLSLSLPLTDVAGAQLAGFEIKTDRALCQIGGHSVTGTRILVAHSGNIYEGSGWTIGGSLEITGYDQHPTDADLGPSAPVGEPGESITGTFDITIADSNGRTGEITNGTFDFHTTYMDLKSGLDH